LTLVAEGDALVGLYLAGQRHRPPDETFGAPAADDDPTLTMAATELAEYFAGARTVFTVPTRPAGTEFQRAVWHAIATVPYGSTTTYAALAAAIGRPTATRAVGAAVGRNPLSIVVPCHRIVGAGGSLTGYAGGLDRKRALLALEVSTSAS